MADPVTAAESPTPLLDWGRRMAAAIDAMTPPPPRPLIRATVTIEPRDGWVGAYIGDGALYLCPVPFLVIKLDRP